VFLKENLPKYIFLFLIIGLIFFLNLKPPLDPDLGWHLRSGQDLIQQKTIPRLDPYSYTMPDWERESHEWLTSGVIYLIYTKWGLFILSIIFALITTLAFFLISRLTKAKIEYSLLAVLLGSLGSLPITGIRVQMITLLGLAILLFILFRFRQDQNKKTIYFLPLLFFIWVNLHGGFSLGLFVLGLFLFFEGAKITFFWLRTKYQSKKTIPKIKLGFLQNKLALVINFFKRKLPDNELVKESLTLQSWLKLVYVSFFSFLLTFINPYGYKVYSLIITIIRDNYGRARIGEWQPFSVSSPIGWEFLMYLALLAILVLIYFKKIDLTLLGLGTVFAFLAFSSWRNMPVLIIMTIPLWVYIVKNATDPVLPALLKKKFVLFLLLLAVAIIGYQQTSTAWAVSHNPDLLAKAGGYPKEAVEYIKANPEKFQGNMYNEYNWGGYLIWQLPEHKVFIDGRMPHLKIGDRHIFKDFNDLQELRDPKRIIEKYNIDWLLIYNNRLLGSYLPSEGFKKVYEDDLSAIFIKE